MSKAQDPKPEIQYVPVQYLDSPNNEDEIDLLDLIETIWNGRKTIAIFTLVFFLLGLFHYLTGPEEYESEAILLQEAQQQTSQNMRLLQQFGGGAGVNDPGTLSANLYPRIIESVEFQHNLLLNEVEFESLGQRVMLYEYFIEIYEEPFRDRFYRGIVNYTIKLPITLYRGFRNVFSDQVETIPDFNIDAEGEILMLNPYIRRSISEMQSRVSVVFDESFINVTSRMPDPKAAAELNVLLIEQIQDYVINYRSEKARRNLEYVEQQYREIEERYEEAQRALARFQDENRGQMTALARIEEERLQNERILTYNLYNNLAQRLEDSRLRLQEETPVFSKLQKPNLPHSPVGSSNLIVIASIILGGLMGIFWIFAKNVFGAIKEK
ncbi:MAG: Wzz/FepE/Etk N-terminal domain-containing protein [Candidatus Paceibacterota bacterium]